MAKKLVLNDGDSSKSIQRQVKFFVLRRKARKGKTAAPFDLAELLDQVQAKPFEDRGRVYQRSDGKRIASWADRTSGYPLQFRMASLRASDWPALVSSKGDVGALRSSGGYLAELSHFAAFKHPQGTVIAAEISRGPRASMIPVYLYGVLGQTADDLEVEGIFTAGLAAQLRGLKSITVGRIRATTSNVEGALKVDQDPLLAKLEAVADEGDLRAFDIVLKPVATNRSGFVKMLGRVAKVLSGVETGDGQPPLVRVSGVSEETGRAIQVDLMDHLLVSHAAVLREHKDARVVDTKHAYTVLGKAYDAKRSEIDAALKEMLNP